MPLTHSLTPAASASLTAPAISEFIDLSLLLVSTLPSSSPFTPPASPAPPKISWALNKSTVQTSLYKATHLKEPWLTRISIVNDISYEALRVALMVEKCATEMKALMTPNDVIEIIGEAREWGAGVTSLDVHKLLHVQAFSPREFLNTIIMRDLAPDENGRRSCIIVSIPREGGLENTANALGVYVSVETVRELGEGRVEVVMASCSDAGGSIPRFVQNLAIASQLWGDGEKFFRYMRENPEV